MNKLFPFRFARAACCCVVALPTVGFAQIQLSLHLDTAPVLTVTAPPGTACQVQWSDNLAVTGRWFNLGFCQLDSAASVTDTNPPAAGPRFYRAVQVPGTNMALIPAGSVAMGDTFAEGFGGERPVHDVSVAAFYMERYEVTRNLWDDVYLWAVTNGYSFDHPGSGRAANHPVQTLDWYDAVKWCNARSEMEGRDCAYFTNASFDTPYRTGQINLANDCVNWKASGYRLPTEAEWEKAARGGAAGLRFPWGNTISPADANYFASTFYNYDTSGTNGFDPVYGTGDPPYTSPVGAFTANAYGLFDLAGNVWEWCWDAFDGSWYDNPGAVAPDPRGPAGGATNRVLRGGSWQTDASFARCANRTYFPYSGADGAAYDLGFRCVITAPVPLPAPLAAAQLVDPAWLGDGAFRFTITNLTPGKTNIVAASADLATWTPVWTNVPVTSTVEFTNQPAPSMTKSFYRTWQVP